MVPSLLQVSTRYNCPNFNNSNPINSIEFGPGICQEFHIYNDLSINLTVIEIVDRLQIDDPVGAVGVHWGGGFWAMVATGLFAQHDKDSPATSGVFHHGNGELLGWNIAAALVVTLWSATTTALVVRTL